jgi:hypothetical protein
MPSSKKTTTAKNAPAEVINNIETKELKENTQYIVKMPTQAKKSSKKQPEIVAEEIPPIVEIVEEPKVEIVEEEQQEDQLVGAEESEEEDEDEKQLRLLQERIKLKNKSKIDDIKEKIKVLAEKINLEYDDQIQEAQRTLNKLQKERDQKFLELSKPLNEQLAKYNPPQIVKPQVEAKKRGGGGKFSNLQSKDGETPFYHERGIKQVYYRDRIIYVGEKTFTIEGRAEEYTSLNKAVEGHYILFLQKKGNCSIWENIYYDDKQSGTRQKIMCLRPKKELD